MDCLTGIDGANYPTKDGNDTFNIYTIAPIENMWFMTHNIEENRELLLEYVDKYRWLISEHITSDDEFATIVGCRNNKFVKRYPRIIVGCTVNISALGSTNSGSFQIEKVMHKKPRGILVTNRPRNAAVHIRLRTKPSIIAAPLEFENFIRRNNMAILMFDDESKLAMRGIVGDRIVRTIKNYNFSPKLLGDCAADVQCKMKALQMKQQQKQINASNNPISNLFSFGNKPIDETYLTYTSGSYVLTGAKHPYMSAFSMWILVWSFTCESIPVTHLASFSVQNIVATYRMPITIDLPRLERMWGQAKIEYFGSHFPAAIYTIEQKVEQMIIELANIIKRIRREIIMDNSRKTDTQRKTDKCVGKMLRSYDTHMINKTFNERFVFEKKAKPEPSTMDEKKINEKLNKFFKRDMSNMPAEMKNKFMNKIMGGKPVGLIYTTGAYVLTGWKDQDVQIAGSEVLYDMLMHFKVKCEEEDNMIADNASGSIVVDAMESSSTQLITSSMGSQKQKISIDPQHESTMKTLSQLVRVDDMAKIARSRTRHEALNEGLIVIKRPNKNKTTEPQPEQKIIPFSRDADLKSRFSNLIKSWNRHRG